ncbi:hypothetical protein Zmor_017394 [Zophobas morio]|uniref:Protein hunchback n=1 Tax=Zophobas morio TaxID=2755281 RepID=A0AA38I8D4_9CUCU|nr:hypothetical protein Zmor_017394 [Zophobas morio]
METYHCKDCDFKTEVPLVFEQHISKHHGPKRESSEETSSEDFRHYGGIKYYFEPNLSLKSSQHTSACTETKENLPSVSSLKESATYNSDFEQTDEMLHSCAECPFKCKFKKYLNRHIKVFHSHKLYTCDKCRFKSRWEGNLKRHINNIHLNDNDKWHRCSQCPFKSKFEATIKRHAMVHHLDAGEAEMAT